jgi:dolichyl-phosphate-mannose-protein mannosyltransferase
VLTISRYIILDPILLFFICGAVYADSKFHNQRDRAFSPSWWLWLSAVGVMLTCAISVKFVGLFVVILVGFRVIADLWEILGDLSRPVVSCSLIWTLRPLCRHSFKIRLIKIRNE